MKRILTVAVVALMVSAAGLPSVGAGGKGSGATPLFNGKDFNGWKIFLDPKAKAEPDKIWSVDNGVIVCEGSVNGYLITEKEYENYLLTVEWKWGKPPVKAKQRNSGVFVHVSGPDKIWPKAIEAQLMEDHAGDFWLVDNFKLNVDPKRQDPKVARHYLRLKDGVEKPVGEWNKYEITCKLDTIKLVINGQLVNEGTGAELSKGKILLQSEGAEIYFRNVTIQSLVAPVAKVDPTKVDPKKEDPKKVDTTKVDPKKVDTTKVEPKKVDTTKVDPKKVDTTKEDPKKVDTTKVDPKKVDTTKEDPKKVDTTKLDPKKVDTTKEEPKKVDTTKLDPKKVDTTKEEPKPAVTKPKLSTLDEYFVLAEKAFNTRKAVIVWVGIHRPDLEKDLANVVHVHLDSFPDLGKNSVSVGVPGQRWLTRYDFPATVTLQQLRAVLSGKGPAKMPGPGSK